MGGGSVTATVLFEGEEYTATLSDFVENYDAVLVMVGTGAQYPGTGVSINTSSGGVIVPTSGGIMTIQISGNQAFGAAIARLSILKVVGIKF